MSNVFLLDCTLRDGGYKNNWEFGKDSIKCITKKMAFSGVDIVEVGFIRNEENDENRAVWNNILDINEYIYPKQKKVLYACMTEVNNPLPLDKISARSEETVDIIRVIVWKSLIKEGFDYCKGLVDLGYKVCIQPDRVNQYTQEEFAEMIGVFNELNPMAIYVVDSNGLLDTVELSEYFRTADKCLNKNVMLGYHGHNNKLQALGVSQALVEMRLERDIIIDASVSGIGRSSGNLNIEIFAEYMNKHYGKDYDISAMIDVYSEYVNKIYKESPWGYAMNTYVTAMHSCNPNYADYFDTVFGLSASEINEVISLFSNKDKVIYNIESANEYVKQYRKKQSLNSL